MINWLNQIDTSLFLFLNSINSPAIDPLMLSLSYSKILMAIIMTSLIIYGCYYLRKKIILALICCIISFGLSDFISTKGFKDNFKRLRPCHQEDLKTKVHLAGKKCWGGKYGFVSSHAANTFSISLFFFLLFGRKKIFTGLFVYAFLVSYSRVYLARHFPGDIIFGAILGLCCGYLGFQLYKKSLTFFLKPQSQDQP